MSERIIMRPPQIRVKSITIKPGQTLQITPIYKSSKGNDIIGSIEIRVLPDGKLEMFGTPIYLKMRHPNDFYEPEERKLK